MGNVILLITCFVIGILLRRTRRLPENAHAAWNGFVIHVSLPALTLVYVHDLEMSPELLFPASMAWLLFGVGCAFFWAMGRLLRLPPRTTGALTLVGGLGNTSFVGLPMIETYYGTRGLGVGIVVDQAGTYLVLSTLGILMATYYRQEGGMNVRAIVKKILTFAPFLAFVLSLVLIPVTYPEWLDALLRRLGGTLVPLALASVGYQIQWKSMRSKLREVGLGLAFKLALGPAIVALVLVGLFAARGETIQITIFEAAMAPQIGAAIVALDHDLDPQLVTLMVGIGTPLSFLTLPLWWQLLQPLGS
jgi:predicted permease